MARMQSTETIFAGITCADVTNWLLSWSALLFRLPSTLGIRCNSIKLEVNIDHVKNINQFEKAKTAKSEWKYINDWKSKSSPPGWSYSYRIKKFVVREKKGSVQILELDSNNRDVDRDSSDESDIDESSDSMRPCKVDHKQLLHSAFFCLFPSPSHSSVGILLSLPHFARPASRKTDPQKNYFSSFGLFRRLERTAKHKGILEIRA